jgi:predicted metal-dependent phosphoesterase TrpH
MPRGPIDLHTHSSVSDGTESPGDLIRSAVQHGLDTVALTDHDTTAGWGEAFEAARGNGIDVVPGMELSTNYGPASVHMLAYLFDPADGHVLALTERIRDGRLHRAESIVANIARDYDLTWEDVLAQSEDGTTLGRPHIADALVAKGIWQGKYYERYYAPSPLEGVELVRAAGGVPVLAHPASHGRYRVMEDSVVKGLVDAGLAGLEVYHRDNTPEGREWLLSLARRFDLIVTGSSDYHGSGKPNRLAENTTTPEALDAIIAQATGTSVFRG